MRRASHIQICTLLAALIGCGGGGGGGGAPDESSVFVVHDPAATFVAPDIVLHHDAATGAGFDWDTARDRAIVSNRKVFYRDDEMLAWGAAAYLEEGIRRLTGRSLTVRSGADVARGIVLLTLDGAPPEIRDDPEVVAALANTGADDYENVEAFHLRSEPDRLLVVANGAPGLLNGVVALLESVDYEVLGMGPNWIHAPDRSAGLTFDVRMSDRPSWYLRATTATSGQYYGVGTIYSQTATPLTDPADEYVDESYWRWRVGTRTWGASMPGFPGHALQAYHDDVVAEMIARGTTEGLLAPTMLGPLAARPAADAVAAGTFWVATEGEVSVSNGTAWTNASLTSLPTSLDLSVAFVREIVLAELIARADAAFATRPDDLFVFGTDPEDGGGYANFAERVAHPTWFVDYRNGVGDPLDEPYLLDGSFGLSQPFEAYDPTSVADCVYAFNDWLLREFDRRLADRPLAERTTSTGRSKSELIRTSFYSYNYHDVPPGFHPDPRMRIMVAGYPKNRGRGRWRELATPADIAAAMRVLLPREPSATYGIWSLAYYQDFGIGGVVPIRSSQAEAIHSAFGDLHAAGIRGWSCETDFNFGKHALSYYLMPRTLWDASLTAADLDALRDRWLQRAFGSGWETMRDYYDLLTPEGWFANTETLWARAVALLEAADAQIDPDAEPAAQRRLDDVKQTWWYHYLSVENRVVATDPDLRTLLWKGQSSYQIAMHVLARRIFGATFLADALGPTERAGAAHYSADETADWWNVVRDAWEETPVTLFRDVTLADGASGADVDVNDLVWTKELTAAAAEIGIPTDRTFWFNSGYQETVTLLQSAAQGDPVGFSLSWTENVERFPTCGIERWDPASKSWEEIVDPTATEVAPIRTDIAFPAVTGWVASYAIAAPTAGTYRVSIGRGGNVAQATGVGYDFGTSTYDAPRPATFFKSQDGLTQYATQPNVFVYIPRGVTSLDLEKLDDNGATVEIFTRGVVTGGAYASRKVTLGPRGTKRIPLQADEDGGVAAFTLIGFRFPLLYSVPQLWARSPAALLVPRRVAEADGLTMIDRYGVRHRTPR